MRFYTIQHKLYCGIDLHTNWMYVCILDVQNSADTILFLENSIMSPDFHPDFHLCHSSDTCHPCYPGRSFGTLPFSNPEHNGLPLVSRRSASPNKVNEATRRFTCVTACILLLWHRSAVQHLTRRSPRHFCIENQILSIGKKCVILPRDLPGKHIPAEPVHYSYQVGDPPLKRIYK